MAADTSPILPGRLRSPGMLLRDDPRADPHMLAAMAPFALDVAPAPPPVDHNSPLEALPAFCAEKEDANATA